MNTTPDKPDAAPSEKFASAQERVDESICETFPASDPPANGGATKVDKPAHGLADSAKPAVEQQPDQEKAVNGGPQPGPITTSR